MGNITLHTINIFVCMYVYMYTWNIFKWSKISLLITRTNKRLLLFFLMLRVSNILSSLSECSSASVFTCGLAFSWKLNRTYSTSERANSNFFILQLKDVNRHWDKVYHSVPYKKLGHDISYSYIVNKPNLTLPNLKFWQWPPLMQHCSGMQYGG